MGTLSEQKVKVRILLDTAKYICFVRKTAKITLLGPDDKNQKRKDIFLY